MTTAERLTAIPTHWTFETSEVARGFDRHVREQLPWYDLLTGAVAHFARHYIPTKGGRVYDLGAATGNIGRALAPALEVRGAEFIAIDNSQAMVLAYAGPGKVVHADIGEFPFEEFDLAVAFLVFMFVPVADRPALIAKLRSKIRPGGALLVVDKTAAPPGYVGTVLHRLTLAGKVATGVEPQEIIEKELSLAGVQRPLSAIEVAFALQGAVEFFRFGEFAGWVVEAGRAHHAG